jgi:uncharacterized protein YaaN involved in tellurite resistance
LLNLTDNLTKKHKENEMTEPNAKDDKPALTDKANGEFQIVIEPSNTNAPTVVGSSTPEPAQTINGLTYANAHTDEREQMNKIIASIDLKNPDTIVALGSDEMKALGTLSDEILDSVQPGVKLAFAEALKSLVELVHANSVEEIRKRIEEGGPSRAFHALGNAILHRDNKIEASKRLIQHFMEDVTHTRQIIQEMANKLRDQQVALDQNYVNINKSGAALVKAAKSMEIVQAATEEKIRRIKSGEDKTLEQLTEAAKSGHPDDVDALTVAQASFSALRTKNGNLVGSVGVFVKQISTLAFTKTANIADRMQTADALTNIVNDWKADLMIFEEVTTENAAVQLLNVVDQLTKKADEKNEAMFDLLVDAVAARQGSTNRNLRSILDSQVARANKLRSVGPQVEAQFTQMESDAAALKAGTAKFKQDMVSIFSNPNGVLAAPPKQAPAPGPG